LDTSDLRGVDGALEEHIEARGRGRLFKFDTSTGLVETLLDNLFFPNGLQLTPQRDAILVNENTAARILK
jgi:adipocyte plasma membrane-associated protein